MTMAEWGLLISLCAATIAALNFSWNVASKFIFPKARVLTVVSLRKVVVYGRIQPFILLSATNLGPAEVTLRLPVVSRPAERAFGRHTFCILNAMRADMTASKNGFGLKADLPKKLAISEQVAVLVPLTKDWFSSDVGWDRLGFTDTFNRTHWCSRTNARELRARLLSEQPNGRHRILRIKVLEPVQRDLDRTEGPHRSRRLPRLFRLVANRRYVQ